MGCSATEILQSPLQAGHNAVVPDWLASRVSVKAHDVHSQLLGEACVRNPLQLPL